MFPLSVVLGARQLQLVKSVTSEPSVLRREAISAEDESAITDIRIAPDGRVFVFGASGQILQMLSEIGWSDDNLQARIELLKNSDTLSESHRDVE